MEVRQRETDPLRRIRTRVAMAAINRLEAECLRRSDVVTALSQYTIDCIAKLHGQSIANRVQLIPGWVDTSRFVPTADQARSKRQLGWPEDIPVLFTLRRLTPRMGLDRLIQACRVLQLEGFRFRLIIGGSGPLMDVLQEQTRTLGLGEIVTFAGRIDDEVLPDVYAACDAFVLPTAELECFGIIALEALSAGRPVLATPVGAIPEIIRQFVPDWIARSSCSDDIAALLRRFLQGDLPIPGSDLLHDQVCRSFSRDRVIDIFVKETIGRASEDLVV
jgi:glycosyltransferase involved in cell wall biosynthesis